MDGEVNGSTASEGLGWLKEKLNVELDTFKGPKVMDG